MQEKPDLTPATRPVRILDQAAALCVIVLTATILYGQFFASGGQPPRGQGGADGIVPPPPPEPRLPAEPVSLDGAAIKGLREARTAIIEYSDFQCPFCARFAIDTLPEIDKTYIATGKLLMAFRHLPLESCDACQDDCGPCCSPDPICGVNGCEQGESCNSCEVDCGVCGTVGSCNDNEECEGGEDKTCDDCARTNTFCESDTDCDVFAGDYICVDDRCVVEDLPSLTQTCQDDSNCFGGESCKNKCGFDCPGTTSTCCKVCIPNWSM